MKLCSIDLVLRHSQIDVRLKHRWSEWECWSSEESWYAVNAKIQWLQVIHCFNHRVVVALKDAFATIHFKNIEEMLLKLYYLYQKSSKHLRELWELLEVYTSRYQNQQNVMEQDGSVTSTRLYRFFMGTMVPSLHLLNH